MKVEFDRIEKCITSLLFISLTLSPLLDAHPAWVQTGVVAYYEGIGAFKNAEGYNSGAQMDITERVDSASNGNIVVTSTFREPTSGYTIVNTTSYGPNDALGAFWYDDRALQSMKTGDKANVFIKGVGNIPFTVTKGPYQDRSGKIWSNAVMLEYKDRTEVRLVYDEKTGILIHQAEVYPSQETYIDLKSVSVDLSNYATPQPAGTPLVNSNAFCGSLFFILAGAALAFARRVER